MRILFLSDSHLGFDRPERPRTDRRRRGPEFFHNFDLALERVFRGTVDSASHPESEERIDLVVHGGDLFYRSRVSSDLVMEVLRRVQSVAESGVPFVYVPGNHERSQVPLPLLWNLPNLYVFDRPRTLHIRVRDELVAISGFPFYRGDLRRAMPRLLESAIGSERAASAQQTVSTRQTASAQKSVLSMQVASTRRENPSQHPAGIRLLCFHQTVEGARVGPNGYQFTRGSDVVPGQSIPDNFAAVLAGHIHRHQVLRKDLSGRPLPAPVIFAGSIERTSFAERNEAKGLVVLDLEPTADGKGRIRRGRFHSLPSRPMYQLEIDGIEPGQGGLIERIRCRLAELPPDSIVRLRINGGIDTGQSHLLCASVLRSIAPRTMNIDLVTSRLRESFSSGV